MLVGMKVQILTLNKQFVVIDSSVDFQLVANPVIAYAQGVPQFPADGNLRGTDYCSRRAGAWQIDAWKLLSKKDFPLRPVFTLALVYDDTDNPTVTIQYSDINLGEGLAGLNGQLVTIDPRDFASIVESISESTSEILERNFAPVLVPVNLPEREIGLPFYYVSYSAVQAREGRALFPLGAVVFAPAFSQFWLTPFFPLVLEIDQFLELHFIAYSSGSFQNGSTYYSFSVGDYIFLKISVYREGESDFISRSFTIFGTSGPQKIDSTSELSELSRFNRAAYFLCSGCFKFIRYRKNF